MAISAGSTITWADFATRCYNTFTGQCCNIGSYYSNVPNRLRSGSGTPAIYTISNIGIAESESKWSATWYANPGNLIQVVAVATVQSEWNAFLSAAGIDARSNELIKAKEFAMAVGLYMQFLAYHVKPIYSRRQIYNTVESQSNFAGVQYLSDSILGAAVTPYYNLRTTNPDTYDPLIMVKNQYMLEGWTWGMFTAYDNPRHPYAYIS
jgi:hypothetical protein